MNPELSVSSSFLQPKARGLFYSRDELVIRPATVEDAQMLSMVITQSFHCYADIRQWFVPVLRLGICEDLRYRLRSVNTHHACFVACLPTNRQGGSVIVGTVEVAVKYLHSLAIAPVKSPYISNLAIDPQYRRLGIARQLLNRCEVQVKRWNYNRISLHVLDNNLAAQQLYFKCGYRTQNSEKTLNSWLFKQPSRLFLQKNLSL